MAGAFLSNEKTSEVVDLLDTATPAGTFFGISPFTSFLPSTYREYAAYADGTIFFTKQLELGLGVRYSRQKQAYEETVSGLLATGSAAVLTPPVATSDQSVMTYLINPKFHITDDVMLYARAASGFRPGGPNFVLAPGLGNPTYDPDRLWSYELGEKATFLDKRATLNFDIYDILWKDIQVTVNVGGVNQLENAGTARVTGAEMSFDYRILPELTLGGSAAYTNARLTSIPAVLDVTTLGVRLPLAPRFNFALIGTYDVDLPGGYKGAINVTDRWIGDRNAAFGTPISEQYVLSSYNITDLNFTVRAPYHLEYGLFVRNVFDKAGRGLREYNSTAVQPRRTGASVPGAASHRGPVDQLQVLIPVEFCSVETASGWVQGLISSGIRQFKGVPYGASTGGANRFQRPHAPMPWTGKRDCFGYAAVSPQVPYDAGHEYARLIQFDLNVAFGGMSEDCLHLNIWTPETSRGGKRAVLVCIHGGGFAICSGNHPMYDGASLARLGDVVVVAVTHRLSSFGYLNLADLDPSGRWTEAGVAGMLDLVAASRMGARPHRGFRRRS